MKEVADAAVKGVQSALVEAEALSKALDSIATSADKARSALDALEDSKTQLDISKVNLREQDELAGAGSDAERAKVKAQANRDRANIRNDASTERDQRAVGGAQLDVNSRAQAVDDIGTDANYNGVARQMAEQRSAELKAEVSAANAARIAADAKAKAAADDARYAEAAFKGAARGGNAPPASVIADQARTAAEASRTTKAAADAANREAQAKVEKEKADEALTTATSKYTAALRLLETQQAELKEAQNKLIIAQNKAAANANNNAIEAGKTDAPIAAQQAAARKEAQAEAEKRRKVDVEAGKRVDADDAAARQAEYARNMRPIDDPAGPAGLPPRRARDETGHVIRRGKINARSRPDPSAGLGATPSADFNRLKSPGGTEGVQGGGGTGDQGGGGDAAGSLKQTEEEMKNIKAAADKVNGEASKLPATFDKIGAAIGKALAAARQAADAGGALS